MYKGFILTFTNLLHLAYSYKAGAPLSSCNTMVPSPFEHHGHGADPTHSDPPYEIKILNALNKPVTEYSPGNKEALKIVIAGERYRGFLLQATSLLGAGRRVGRFIPPLPSGTQFLDCDGNGSNSAVTHDCGHSKHDLRFLWPTPRYDIGPVQFTATIVYNKTSFWTNVQSLPLYPRSTALSTDTVNTSRCGRGFGCFRIGANGCDLDDSCNFTLVWKCLKKHVLFEFMASMKENSKKYSSGTYVGIAVSNDSLPGNDEMYVCQIYGNKTRISNLYNYANKPVTVAQLDTLEPIKFIYNDHNRFYCRFIRRWHSSQRKFYFFVSGTVNEDGLVNKPDVKNMIPMEHGSWNICSHPNIIAAVTRNNALGSKIVKINIRTLLLEYFLFCLYVIVFKCHAIIIP